MIPDDPNLRHPWTDFRSLARMLTKVENDLPGSAELLKSLKRSDVPVIGITGPPGAGKSTLVNALINELARGDQRIAVLAVDPTSPFNFGSLLGDRIRMAEQFNKENVYIRSIATRGSLGGLSAKSIEMVDVLKSAGFDYILVETVGVGQSEVEIAGLADVTLVVLVPESGDEIQQIKSGLMEIADIFVVNKCDREGADRFASNLQKLAKGLGIPVIKTIADKRTGLDQLVKALEQHHRGHHLRREQLLADKAWKLLQEAITGRIDRNAFRNRLVNENAKPDFNLYRFIEAELKNFA
ncbi:MAG TPA: methylmalonyl Co-A mutase-associated GTPase MeaB [Sphingobacteriaceae bacterium]